MSERIIDEKAVIEAILFASPHGISIEALSQKSNIPIEKCKKILEELSRQKFVSGVALSEHNGTWSMRVHSDLNQAVRDLAKIEFPKSLLETLSIIAYKSPVTQAAVIKVRGNKAYNHVVELVNLGFVSSKSHGRTNKLSLTQKFYEYFDIGSQRQLKELFKMKT